MLGKYSSYMNRMYILEEKLSQEDSKVLEKFMDYCRLGAGEEKVLQRRRYALQFLDIAQIPFKKFNQKIIEGIYVLIKNSDREVAGKNEAIKNLKFFVRWLKNNENLVKNLKPIPRTEGYNSRKINPNTLISDEEIEGLIRACENLKEKCMIALQIECGLRPHELLNLKWKDIKINGDVGELNVYSSKTKRSRVIPFKTSLIHLNRWKQEYLYNDRTQEDYLFPNSTDRNKPHYQGFLSYLYRKLQKKTRGRHIYPYLARHTKLTQINKRVPSKVASAYGGHSEKTAQVYTHLTDSDISEVILENIYNIKEPQIQKRKELEGEIKKLNEKLDNSEKNYLHLALEFDLLKREILEEKLKSKKINKETKIMMKSILDSLPNLIKSNNPRKPDKIISYDVMMSPMN